MIHGSRQMPSGISSAIGGRALSLPNLADSNAKFLKSKEYTKRGERGADRMKRMDFSINADSEKIDYGSYVHEALKSYDICATSAELIRHNENITFDIHASEGHFILRIRRQREGFALGVLDSGISPFELLSSETGLLGYIAKRSSLTVQEPVKTKNGGDVCDVRGYPACLLRYIDGTPLAKDNVQKYAGALGTLASELHSAAEGFVGKRYVYSHSLLCRLKAEVTKARDAAHMTSGECSVCARALDAIDLVMTRLDSVTGMHLIHADMGAGNIILTERGLTAIDFSLCGYGYRAMECGMLASNFSSDEAIENMRLSYNRASGTTVSRYDTDAFLALSVLLFIGCQHARYYQDDWFVNGLRRWTTGCLEPSNWVNDMK